MKKRMSISFLIMIVMMLVLSSVSAFATSDKVSIALPSSDKTAMTNLMKSLESLYGDSWMDVTLDPKATDVSTKLFVLSDSSVEFDKATFDNATEKSRKEVVGRFITGLQDSTVSDQSQQSIINTIQGASSEVSRLLIPLVMDSTSADLYSAMKILAPFLPIIRIIFGVGAVVIFLFLMVSTIIDLCVIGLPFAREGALNKADQGSGRVPFVSSDALSVVKETESDVGGSGGYKNAYLIYFKRRAFTFIILSICVLYLVVGELGGVIAWLLNLGSGLV